MTLVAGQLGAAADDLQFVDFHLRVFVAQSAGLVVELYKLGFGAAAVVVAQFDFPSHTDYQLKGLYATTDLKWRARSAVVGFSS